VGSCATVTESGSHGAVFAGDGGAAAHMVSMNRSEVPCAGAVGRNDGAVHTFYMNTKYTPSDLLWAITVDGGAAAHRVGMRQLSSLVPGAVGEIAGAVHTPGMNAKAQPMTCRGRSREMGVRPHT